MLTAAQQPSLLITPSEPYSSPDLRLLNAPQTSGLAQAARKRAGMQRRRRVATAAGSLLAVVGVATTSFVMWGPQGENVVPVEPAVTVQEPKFTGPLTREECPGNSMGLSGGFFDGLQKFPPAEEQARDLGPRFILSRHPSARLMEGRTSADQIEFLYVLPNGYRVARIEFEPSPQGWYMKGMAYC
jgi:hypothetical protein